VTNHDACHSNSGRDDLGPSIVLASWGGPLPCRQSTQRHFEPFCFFLQADPAQFAYQPCPIMRYLPGNSCRNFFVCASHAQYAFPRMRKRLTHHLDELERSRFYKGCATAH